MWDANGVFSEAVYYSLEQADDDWIMTIHADAEWIEAEERRYPITIDPSYNVSGSKLEFTTAIETGTPPSTSDVARPGQLSCGYSKEYGNMEGYARLTSLPDLPAGSTIIEAKLRPNAESHWAGVACRMDIRMMTEGLTDTQWGSIVSWSQRPNASDTAMDFVYLETGESYSLNPNKWDITPAMMQWYEDPSKNYGLRITASTDGEDSDVNSWCRFGPTESYVTITYRNTVGTEGYYTYETQSAGRAGTGYVCDFTSNLTVFKNDLNYSSTTIPFSLNHVYNSSLCGTELYTFSEDDIFAPDFSKMKMGNGWQLSTQESVRQTTINTIRYLVYRDGDGTIHYFKHSSDNVYVDEDGLGLNITQATEGSDVGYMMRDQSGNQKYFRNGYLKYIQDANGNKICFLYNGDTYNDDHSTWHPPETGAQLTQIVAVNEGKEAFSICTFSYNSNNQLFKITDFVNRETTFTYANNGNLTQITHPDGTVAYYGYNSDGQLVRVFDDEADYGIEYGYDGNEVSKIHEYTASSIDGTQTVGAQIEREKLGLQNVIYRYDGDDRRFSTETNPSTDDIINLYAFDYTGRTINAVTLDYQEKDILGVTAAAYTDTSSESPAANNKIEKTAQSGQNGVNLLVAGGIETHDGYTPSASDWSATTSTSYYKAEINSTQARTGNSSLKTWISTSATANSGSNKRVAMYQTVQLEAEKTYTFSAYVNTESISGFEDEGGVYVAFMNTSNSIQSAGDMISFATNADIDDGWQRVYATFTCETAGKYRVAVVQENAYGTAYFDDLQLEEGSIPTNVNLLQNGTFGYSAEWTRNEFAYENGNDALHPGVMSVVGDPEGYLRAYQHILIGKNCTDQTFLLSGWGKAASGADAATDFNWIYGSSIDNDHGKRYFGLIARCWYIDANNDPHAEYFFMPFNDEYDDWQFASCVIAPGSYYQSEGMTLAYIDVYVAYDNNFNTMSVDNISLRQEPCATYTYDSNGAVTAVNSSGSDSQTVEYVEGTIKPSTVRTTGSGVYIYQYDENDADNDYLPSYVSNYTTKVYTRYFYDEFGNTTETHIGNLNTEGSLEIKSYADYSDDGSLLVSQTNGNGQTTKYTYNSYRTKIATEDAKGTKVQSAYDYSNDRTKMSYISGKISVAYEYSKGLMTKITRGGFTPDSTTKQNQTYTMAYDSFGNMTSVAVGNITLATYDYGSKNNHLASMTYGNDHSITYEYDELDRVVSETWDDGTKYQYVYNSESALAKKIDATDQTKVDAGTADAVNYEYDSLGRLIYSYQVEDGKIVQLTEHQYDRANRISKQSWQLRNSDGTYKTYSDTYTYRDSDGALTKVTGVAINDYTFEYDNLGRVSARQNALFRQDYTYRSISSSVTTTQISKINFTKQSGGASFSEFALSYTYDELGNIKTITNSANSADNRTYTYDVQGQLLTEKIGSTTYTYTYDTYGNIRTASDGTTTHTYTYGNTQWLDLLTAYDGQSITYDAIGNPTSYYNGTRWTFGWAKGRQLASASNGTTSVAYTYDMNGIRDSKTVGGVTYNFITQNGKVVRQTGGGHVLDISYDVNGRPYSLTLDNVKYLYVLNQQGDVIRIVNCTDGSTAAEYRYDAWGRILSATGSIASVNPIRYRGYYYDTESGFYYLQSRYYDPTIGRFINADSFASTGQGFLGYNMFVYCNNSPIIHSDETGMFLCVEKTNANYSLQDSFGLCIDDVGVAGGVALGFDIWAAIDKLCDDIAKSFARATPRSYKTPQEEHHLIARNSPYAAPAAEILNAVLPEGVESPLNRMYIKTGLHRRLHTKLYYGLTNCIIVNAYYTTTDPKEQQQNVIIALGTIRGIVGILDAMARY